MSKPYKKNLSYVHDAGFGKYAEHAATVLLARLQDAGIHEGLVIDVGCGSGITARRLCDAGYEVLGIDLSEDMIELARQRVPEGTFKVGSFAEADLPRCVAVCAIGEVLNYGFDASNCSAVRSRFIQSAYAAIIRGGILLFDCATPERASASQPEKTFFEGDDWTLLVERSWSSETPTLTRRIVTFLKDGETYTRDEETHTLELIEADETDDQLRSAGFEVQRLTSYDSQVLPQGLIGFLAKKPLHAQGR